MRRERLTKFAVAGGAVALALSSPITGAYAGSAPDTSGSIAQLIGQQTIRGVLSTPAGTRVSTVSLALVAWPTQSALSRMTVGHPVQLTTVAMTSTDTQGNFAFPLAALSSALRARADASGLVNLEVVGATPRSGVVPYGLTAVVPVAVAQAHSVARLASPADATGLRLRTDPALAKADGQQPSAPGATGTCTSTLTAQLANAWADLAGVFVATGQVTGRFTYSKGATSELGIGISATGASGSFSASGTSATSSTATQAFPLVPQLTDQYEQTLFKWGKYHVLCYSRGVLTGNYYEARSNGWAGGTGVATASPPLTPYCVPELAGSGFTTESSSTASTVVGGSLTRGIIGITLSAQTGYSSTASLGYDFILSGHLCGQNDYIGGTPGTLVARP
jgi:hypothetical protein